MARRIATGIDIGTHQTKIVVVEEIRGAAGPQLRIIGTGLADTTGVKHGYVVDTEDAAESLRAAKKQAEATAQVPIRAGFLSIGGISIDEARATGEAIISRADQEITELDLEKVRDSARQAAAPAFLNRRILHEVPLEYRVDGTKMLGDPVGMKGTRIAADFLFVTTLAQHADTLIAVAEAADIDIIDTMASPLAGSYVTLTKDQKMKGCLLANIGAETVSVVIYDEGTPVSVKVFATGSTHITDDLALGFKVSLEDAERIKLGRLGGQMYSKKKVDDIITARFKNMFDLIDKHLKSLGRQKSLPAGIIFSGGGSGQGSITDIAKGSLSLPARIADMKVMMDTKIRDATWSVAYGLALWGLTGDTETPKRNSFFKLSGAFGRFLKQFMP